jgi:hypothetical protein
MAKSRRGPKAKPQAAPSGTNKKAVFSFVAGIVGFVLFLAAPIVAILFGLAARKEIAADPEQSGDGYAKAGIILGVIGIPYGIVVLALLAT